MAHHTPFCALMYIESLHTTIKQEQNQETSFRHADLFFQVHNPRNIRSMSFPCGHSKFIESLNTKRLKLSELETLLTGPSLACCVGRPRRWKGLGGGGQSLH